MPDSPSSDKPPPYTLPVYKPKKRADSFVSTIDNYDLEKAMPTPATPDTHNVSPLSSPADSGFLVPSFGDKTDNGHGGEDHEDDSIPIIHISDEHPASTPPSPSPVPTSTPAPAYHRPFSPPVAWPSPAHTAHRKGSAGSISIMIHTETRTS